MSKRAFSISIPDRLWEETGSEENPRSRLLATATINEQHFHVEAYEVTERVHHTPPLPPSEWPTQEIADFSFESEWHGLAALRPDDGAFRTVTIQDRQYVIIVSPFCV